jgi:hypothetical protein
MSHHAAAGCTLTIARSMCEQVEVAFPKRLGEAMRTGTL